MKSSRPPSESCLIFSLCEKFYLPSDQKDVSRETRIPDYLAGCSCSTSAIGSIQCCCLCLARHWKHVMAAKLFDSGLDRTGDKACPGGLLYLVGF